MAVLTTSAKNNPNKCDPLLGCHDVNVEVWLNGTKIYTTPSISGGSTFNISVDLLATSLLASSNSLQFRAFDATCTIAQNAFEVDLSPVAVNLDCISNPTKTKTVPLTTMRLEIPEHICGQYPSADVNIIPSATPTKAILTGVATNNTGSLLLPAIDLQIWIDGVQLTTVQLPASYGGSSPINIDLTSQMTVASHLLEFRAFPSGTESCIPFAIVTGITVDISGLTLQYVCPSSVDCITFTVPSPPLPWWLVPSLAIGGVVLGYAFLVGRGHAPSPSVVIERATPTVRRVYSAARKRLR